MIFVKCDSQVKIRSEYLIIGVYMSDNDNQETSLAVETEKIEGPSPRDLYDLLMALPKIDPHVIEIEMVIDGKLTSPKNLRLEKNKDGILSTNVPSFVSYIVISCSNLQNNAEIYLRNEDLRWNVMNSKDLIWSKDEVRIPIREFSPALKIVKSSWGKGPSVVIKDITAWGFSTFANDEWQQSFLKFSQLVESCHEEIQSNLKNVASIRLKNETTYHEFLSEKEAWHEKVESSKAEIELSEQAIAKLKEEKTSLEEVLTILQDDQVQQQAKLSESVLMTKAETEQLEKIKRETNDKQALQASLDRSIADKHVKLEELNRDVSLFAVDLKGYGDQGSKQARLYAFFLFLYLSLGLALTSLAFDQVNEIWKTIVADPTKVSWGLIAITRFSVFVIYSAAVGALSTLAFSSIKRIMQIHDRSLRLSEISIIARDITEASLTDTGATIQQRSSVFFSTRMMLIRNLLAGTFEKLNDSIKKEKEDQLLDLKATDLASFVKMLKDVGVEIK